MLMSGTRVGNGLLLGVSGAIGAAFGLALVTAGHRMRGWKALPFFLFVIIAGLLIDGYREFPQTSVGAAALFALSACFTILAGALIAGLRRPQPDRDS